MIHKGKQNGNIINQYFQKYKVKLNSHLRSISEVHQIQQRIQQQIETGNLGIHSNNSKLEQKIAKMNKQIRIKKQKFNKQLMLLNISLQQNINLKRSRSSQNRRYRPKSLKNQSNNAVQISQQEITDYKNKKRDSDQRLKQLMKVKQRLTIQKKQKQELKQQLENERKQTKRLQNIQQQQLLKRQKLKGITRRLKRLQQNRSLRKQRLKASHIRSAPIIPKYKQIQKQFMLKQKQQQQRRLQIHKQNMLQINQKYTADSIQHHVNKYKQELSKIRSKSTLNLKYNNQQIQKKRQRQFNLNNSNPQQIQYSKIKQSRIKQYSQILKVNRQNLAQDPKIGKSIQIYKDKQRNPFKYHYLSQKKNLTYQQIYDNFQHFNFQSDPKQLGNVYLNQIKQKINSLSIKNKKYSSKRSKTQSTAQTQQTKKKYINYMQGLKISKSKQVDQVQQLIRVHGQKSKVIEILNNRSQIFQKNCLLKIQQAKKAKNYLNTVICQNQMDEQFIKSIKQKLKIFKIK